MSDREQAIELLKEIPDYKMGYIVAYLRGAAIPEEIPNDETLEAFTEVDEMKRTGGGEHFDGSTKELFKMILEG